MQQFRFIKISILFILFIEAEQSSAQNTSVIYLGKTPVNIIKQNFGKPSISFIDLHENETTSVQAARKFLQEEGTALLVKIHQKSERNIEFWLQNKKYLFDPNRIFTSTGRRKTLEKLSSYAPAAEKEVEKFADSILSNIKYSKLIIALHNNTEGAPLSIKNYIGSIHFKTFVNSEMDADDFFLTTEQSIFDFLKEKKMNVVFELPDTVLDDGSLSIYCNKNKIPYINVEAQEDHFTQQLQMLETLREIIKQYK
ncbi:MAG: hypothetical protein ABJA79_03545 [Parafilimonas sp.]